MSAGPTSDQSSERTPFVTIRVVIAEDEAIIRLDLKESLEEEGYEVVGEAGRGDQAIDLVRELRPDLVMLDIKMPVMDGLTAARTIAAERICAVLMLTAFSQREIIEEARAAATGSASVWNIETSGAARGATGGGTSASRASRCSSTRARAAPCAPSSRWPSVPSGCSRRSWAATSASTRARNWSTPRR
jgi:CheY-like chemotaxis protein